MSRRNGIIVSAEPRGRFVEGVVATGETFYPGMLVQPDISEALQGGRHVYEIYNADADGGRPKGAPVLVIENYLLGKLMTEPYTAGERFFGYVPEAGEEYNLLLLNIAGTADDHTKGEMLIVDDTTGKFIATTGSPETEMAMLKETITDPTADTLAWCEWTGY